MIANTTTVIKASPRLIHVYKGSIRKSQRAIVEQMFEYINEKHDIIGGYEGTPEYAEAMKGMYDNIEDELSGQPDKPEEDTTQINNWEKIEPYDEISNYNGMDIKYWEEI